MEIKAAWERLREIVDEHIIRKPVTLASGKKSNFYIDGKEVSLTAEGAALNAILMYDKFKDMEFDAVGGITMGSDPIIGSILPLCFQNGRDTLGYIIRKEPKGHGRGKLVEGPELPKGGKLIMLEDVCTTGGTAIKAIKHLREEYDAEIIKVICIVNRQEGADENFAEIGVKLDQIFVKSDFEGLD